MRKCLLILITIVIVGILGTMISVPIVNNNTA